MKSSASYSTEKTTQVYLGKEKQEFKVTTEAEPALEKARIGPPESGAFLQRDFTLEGQVAPGENYRIQRQDHSSA